MSLFVDRTKKERKKKKHGSVNRVVAQLRIKKSLIMTIAVVFVLGCGEVGHMVTVI